MPWAIPYRRLYMYLSRHNRRVKEFHRFCDGWEVFVAILAAIVTLCQVVYTFLDMFTYCGLYVTRGFESVS